MNSRIEKEFVDANGKSNLTIEGNEAPLGGDFINNHHILANRPNNKKPKIQAMNIGPGSNGFAGVAVLASIIALAGVIIAYLTLRY